MPTTLSDDVLDPQVLAPMVSAQLVANLVFADLVDIDRTLEGRPGSTVEFPSFNYVGDAEDVEEGVAIEPEKLTFGSTAATIKEIGKGIGVTDKAMLTGYGDIGGEISKQLGLSLANKTDNDIKDAFLSATQTQTTTATVDGLQEAVDNYALEDNVTLVLVASPKAAGKLRLNAAKDWLRGSEMGSKIVATGTMGEVNGVQIVRSRKLDDNTAILIKMPSSASLQLSL
ncbi:N4-gp56 family major capsid protein [Ligilactobacillus equi]